MNIPRMKSNAPAATSLVTPAVTLILTSLAPLFEAELAVGTSSALIDMTDEGEPIDGVIDIVVAWGGMSPITLVIEIVADGTLPEVTSVKGGVKAAVGNMLPAASSTLKAGLTLSSSPSTERKY
jgi:hypothetical protein